MSKNVAWSYSSINQFRTCPKQYFHEKIAKDFKQKYSDESDYGKEVHKAFQLRVAKNVPLPLNLRQYEPRIAKLAESPGQKYCEMRLALNDKFKPVDFFAPDVYCRAIIDLLIVNGDKGLIIDYKTGKVKPDFDQLELAAAMVFKFAPELTKITVAYFWLRDNSITRSTIDIEKAPSIWAGYFPLVNRLNHAIQNSEFPARPNGLCKQYCPVKSCAFNGV